MAKYGFKSQEQLAAERSVREAKREERKQKYGTNIPDAEEKKRIEAEEMAARAADVAKRAAQAGGATDEQAMAAGEEARSFSQATPNERTMAAMRQRDKELLGGFKTYGDKARFDQMNAVRKLQGKEALDADPLKQFDKDMSKSMAFGAESSLNTPEGRQRAMQAGVKAGLSFNDADTAVQGAFKRLQEIGKRDKTTAGAAPAKVGVPPMLALVPEPKTPKPPSATQTAAAELPTQTPEQAVREQVGNVVAGATGFNEGGRNAALQAAQGGSLAANLMRQYSKGAINKEVDAIAEAGGRTRTSLGRESKSLLEEYNKAKGATVKMQQLAKGATEGSPLAKGLATVTQKAAEAGTKSTDALKKLQAAAERSGAQKAADFGRKVLGSKVLKGVSRLGNIAQVAEPILESYKYNKNPELFDEKMEAILERNEAGIAPTIGAAVRDVVPTPVQAFNPNYSPVSTLAATIVSPLESFRRYSEAKGEAAYQTGAAEIARRKGDALTEQRRSMVSDEEYAKMSAEQKRESSIKAAEALRQLREAARKRNQ
jgi:hypothetical protein